MPSTPEIESAIMQAKKEIEKLEKKGIKPLPEYGQLYNDVLEEESKEMYAKYYRTYSRAIHLNRDITQKLAWIQYEKKEPKAVLCKDDIESNGDELLIVASISCDINKMIREFYGWHSDTIQNEYEQIEAGIYDKGRFSSKGES